MDGEGPTAKEPRKFREQHTQLFIPTPKAKNVQDASGKQRRI